MLMLIMMVMVMSMQPVVSVSIEQIEEDIATATVPHRKAEDSTSAENHEGSDSVSTASAHISRQDIENSPALRRMNSYTANLCSPFYHGTIQDRSRIADQIVNDARSVLGLSPLKPG